CGYAANLEKARARPAAVKDDATERTPDTFHTPNVRTIDELVKFAGVGPEHLMKSVAYALQPTKEEQGTGKPGKAQLVLALVRGDDEVNEAKLGDALGGAAFRPAHPEEIRRAFGASPGSLGPLGVKGVRILIDEALRGRHNLITGANQDDYHVRHLTPEEDFSGTYHDLRIVAGGDACPQCGQPLQVVPTIEVGHIFKLGRRYAEALGARVLDPKGKEVTLIMGSYGIGVERILSAAIEQHHDEHGMKLPASIAPFQVVLTATNMKDDIIREAAERLYAELQQAGVEVLYDDRNERAGVKFKDADLIGVPLRVTVGKKAAQGVVELSERSTGVREDAKMSQMVSRVKGRSAAGRPS
ncbi:MAG: YbaK/EbsC family protein, partial [Terriglobia bacterium]